MHTKRAGFRHSSTFIASICVACFAGPAMAQGGASEYDAWLVNLLKTHAGHEYCPPPGATILSASKAMLQYYDEHFGRNKQLTDAEWVKILSDIYPCPKPETLSPEAAKSLGSRPLGSVSGNYIVKPSGVYASIDNGPMLALLKQLHGPPSNELRRAIEKIEHNGGSYPPPVLMQIAVSKFSSGDLDGAIFWIHAGLLRAVLDTKLCLDPTVAAVPNALVKRMPPELVRAAFSEDKRVGKALKEVLA